MKTEIYDIALLYSGGLDSKLAARILANQNIKVLGVKFIHPFLSGLMNKDEKFYHDPEIRIDILEIPLGDEYLELIKNPSHGYGANANPCIDCKIFFMKHAWEIAKGYDAKGLATGFVIGQRPFSQRNTAIKFIEKEAGLVGKIIHPLTAKNFPPTELELSGLVNREKLYDIKGRGRIRQLKLAEELGIAEYPSPAGGCLLTDPGYSARFFEAIEHNDLDLETTQLLKFGRHFRIDGKRVVIGRNEEENDILETNFSVGRFLLIPENIPGPSAVVEKDANSSTLKLTAKIIGRYSRKLKQNEMIIVGIYMRNEKIMTINASPADPLQIDEYHIALKHRVY